MLRRTVSAVAVAFISTLLLVQEVGAQTALNRAVVESLRNQVQLLQDNRSARAARVSDVLVPGNGVSTAQQSFAELRFNDGSLGRLGERVVFWFTPGSREFRLSNGTALLLIPPGRGRTNVHTPNATAGIQGSALFVRYIAETDTTLIGALTDSGIEMINQDGSQRQVLRGGEMAVAVGDRITQIYEFDLRTFYETSQLVEGLAPEMGPGGLTQDNGVVDAGIAEVQEEMRSAIAQQSPLPSEGVMETPEFVRLPTNAAQVSPVGDLMPSGSGVVPRSEGGSGVGVRSRDRLPNVRPGLQPFENRIERTTVDPRRDDRPDSAGRPDGENRPGQGNGRPDRENQPGQGNGRPDGGSQPGQGNGRPDGGSQPGQGNGRPDGGNSSNSGNRPNNGNGSSNRVDQPGRGNRPTNGNGSSNGVEQPNRGNRSTSSEETTVTPPPEG